MKQAVILFLLFVALPLGYSQDKKIETFVFTGARFAWELGYNQPAWRGGVELDYGRGRWGITSRTTIGRDVKAYVGDGVSLSETARLSFAPVQKLAVFAGVAASRVWTSQYEKTVLNPTVGLSYTPVKNVTAEASFLFPDHLTPNRLRGLDVRVAARYPLGESFGVKVVYKHSRDRFYQDGLPYKAKHNTLLFGFYKQF